MFGFRGGHVLAVVAPKRACPEQAQADVSGWTDGESI
jgi:hypothetical protein